MAEITRREWSVYPRGDFFPRYDGQQAILLRPEGIAVVWMGDFEENGRTVQHLDCETVIDGRVHRLIHRRPPSQAVTPTGAKRIATRWLRSLQGAAP